jgi:hypothetical protein
MLCRPRHLRCKERRRLPPQYYPHVPVSRSANGRPLSCRGKPLKTLFHLCTRWDSTAVEARSWTQLHPQEGWWCHQAGTTAQHARCQGCQQLIKSSIAICCSKEYCSLYAQLRSQGCAVKTPRSERFPTGCSMRHCSGNHTLLRAG